MKFLITSTGRTGTKFLTFVLNSSQEYRVLHEPAGTRDSLQKARERFSVSTNYGEVNPQVLSFAEQLDVDYKGVIIRDPIEILDSWLRRNKFGGDVEKNVTFLDSLLEHIDSLIQQGANILYFSKLFQHDYLSVLLKALKIDSHYLKEFSLYRSDYSTVTTNKGAGRLGDGLYKRLNHNNISCLNELKWFYERYLI